MIIDKELVLSDAQAVTATANSSNVIDIGMGSSPVRRAFVGEPMWIVVDVNTTTTSSGSTTVDFDLVSSASSTLSTPTSLFKVSAVAKATLVAGYQVMAVRVPAAQALRYIGLIYTVNTADLTAGKFDAFLVKDADFNTYYASGFSNAF